MLLEDILILLLIGSMIFFIGIPLYKIAKKLMPKKPNPLKDAKVRLEQVRLEVEAAKLNKEAEKLISGMYEETLEETEINKKERL